MIVAILYILCAGFFMSWCKEEQDAVLLACFALIIGVFLIASSGDRVSCDENGDCEQLDSLTL